MTRDDNLHVDLERLIGRIHRLGEVGALEGGGVCRLALSPEDKAARDLVVGWMTSLGLSVTVDGIGNLVAVRPGRRDGPPVMTGSHIDTVATGGLYDGNLGVLAGLEVVETLNDAGLETEYPLAVAVFTNEESARFAPDMMGSQVFAGGLDLEAALAVEGIDGESVGACLERIGYRGKAPCGRSEVRAFVELHVEQGPVLEAEGITIGAVEKVQGISWTEVTIGGVSNHAGTTPMALRRDAGHAAAALACEVRRIAEEAGQDQVGTVGAITLKPNLINVIANQAMVTVDLRNTDETRLQAAERRLDEVLVGLRGQGFDVETRRLARFEPVDFDPAVVAAVEAAAEGLGHSVKRMPSGAGHGAQMLARVCPSGMIFVPSQDGISHNVREFTKPEDIGAGANILLRVLLDLAGEAA
jgi:N-carbamoyl-L-amino-acid hydrolase